MRWVRQFSIVLALLFIAAAGGCVPAGTSEADEAKEPHFIEGKSRVKSMDFRGAIDEFQRALKAIPDSASAHYELGWLYEQKESDPAAAIYHYQRYLQLRPKAENAELIRQRIVTCKQDLAKTVLPLPLTPNVQRQIEPLIDEVKRLREENERWRNYFASISPGLTNPPSQAGAQPLAPGGPNAISNPPQAGGTPSPERSAAAEVHPLPAARTRTHTVQSGESPYSIARRYSVKLDSLMQANPGIDPRRLRVGQTLAIPAQ